MLGGLITQDQNDSNNDIPYLNRIPILGKLLFSTRTRNHDRSELIILMHPEVVNSNEEQYAVRDKEEAKTYLGKGLENQLDPVQVRRAYPGRPPAGEAHDHHGRVSADGEVTRPFRRLRLPSGRTDPPSFLHALSTRPPARLRARALLGRVPDSRLLPGVCIHVGPGWLAAHPPRLRFRFSRPAGHLPARQFPPVRRPGPRRVRWL